MTTEELKKIFSESNRVKLIVEQLSKGKVHLFLKGLVGSADAFYIQSLFHAFPATCLVIAEDKEDAVYLFNDLEQLCKGEKVMFFPSSSRVPYVADEMDNANVLMRAEVLSSLSKDNRPAIIVTYPEALVEKVVTKKHLEKNSLEIISGQNYSIDFIDEVLLEYEFEKVDFVYEPGQFSIRGGIIDIFSFAHEDPYRIEFFGDDVDSIRTFDTITQLSKQKMGKITVIPNVQDKILRESRDSFFEFLPDNSLIWMKSFELTIRKLDLEFERAEKAFSKLETLVAQLPPEELYIHSNYFKEKIEKYSLIEFGRANEFGNPEIFSFDFLPQPAFNKNFELLAKNFEENTKNGFKNIILAEQSKQVERLYAIFEDINKDVQIQPLKLPIREGFIDRELKLACYTDHQIFERYHRYKLKDGFNKTKEAITLKELLSLQKGDYVTHIDYGVGQYSGLEKIDVNGKEQEAIRLIYKGGDVLYVSIHSLHRIAKYTGKDGTAPVLHKLGTATWQNLKQKTKKKVKEIAYDLIKLYAKRRTQKGFAFAPDTYMQTELEASFIYEDTPDQYKATVAVKKDMELETPMDRLICGDVGFGKTEIAMRAAFKAICDSKQVAVMCPTTILSIQHFKSFSERLKDFPVTVDYINRFKSTKAKKETLTKVAEGKVDILIGTHAIVSKDVKFKDLGLLIIDEEQKFGVGVKDKLKLFKANVDTLTLTATPIPRTLQFSLMGARDLSVINTPPPNRYPVQTEITTFNEEIIRDRIMYEVNRGGQVYFIHNRVQNILEIAGLISRICPNVRVKVGHGQMDGASLENVMIDFIEGMFDVLVATTIVESGIDIPNANTIIINDAHNFGLSDLHQLRGRVGRSNKRAFCVLLTQPTHTLSSESRKRLAAIEQFSNLGSGFSIAMRDLDIRGAGNLLGGEQSGFITDIGFETYQKILDEAIQELRENEFKDLYEKENKEQHDFVHDCVIETDMELLLPDNYVNNVNERLVLYRELDAVKNEFELDHYRKKLNDRFGPLPLVTQELLQTIKLRWKAKEIGIEKMFLKNNKMICYFISNENSPFYQTQRFTQVLKFVQEHHGKVKMEEKNKRLQLAIIAIDSIDKAMEWMNKIN